MAHHQAVATTNRGRVSVIMVPTQDPYPDEVQIQVEYASVILPDVYATDRGSSVPVYPHILGHSASGVVCKVGSGIRALKVGDRVTAFTYGASRHKALQRYVNAQWSVVAKLPEGYPLDQAASIPDNFVTAFYTVFNQLGLPIQRNPPAENPLPHANTPILIYGGGSLYGQYMIQMLRKSGYHTVLATATQPDEEYVTNLGAIFIDSNSPNLLQDITHHAGGDGKIKFAVDCISSERLSLKVLSQVMSPYGTLAVLLPLKEGAMVTNSASDATYWEIRKDKTPFPESTVIKLVGPFNYQEDRSLRDFLMCEILPGLLKPGLLFRPNRMLLMQQGSLLDRVKVGLALLRHNQARGRAIIVKWTE